MVGDLSDSGNATPFRGWRNVGLFFVLQFAASGFVYFAYSVVFPVMVEAMDWNRGTASLAQSIALILFGLAYPLTAFLIGRIGARDTFTLGLGVMLAGLVMVITLVSDVWSWVFIWGLVLGMSFALTGPIVSQSVMIAWFIRRRATAIGIVLTGGALGGAVSQPVLAFIMEQSGNWQSAWWTAIAMVLLSLVVARFITDRPADIGQHADNADPSQLSEDVLGASPARSNFRSSREWTLKEVVRTRPLYMLMFVSVGHLATFFFLLNHGVLHLTDGGMDRIEAASVIGLAILGSGLARVPAGWLGDTFELRWLVFGSVLLMIAALAGLWMLDGFIPTAIAAMLFGAGYGSLLVLNPTVIGNYFGEKAFPKINSLFAPILLPFAAAAPAGGGYIFEATGSYDLAFAIMLAVLGVSAIAGFFLTPPENPA